MSVNEEYAGDKPVIVDTKPKTEFTTVLDAVDGIAKNIEEIQKGIVVGIAHKDDKVNIKEVVDKYGLNEKDFDIDKSGNLDDKEKALYDSYSKSNELIIKYSQRSVDKFIRNSLISNIILGAIFLLQLILNSV